MFVTFKVTAYICVMIRSILHKGLKRLWQKDDSSKLPAEQVDKIRRILEALDAAKTLEPLSAIQGTGCTR